MLPLIEPTTLQYHYKLFLNEFFIYQRVRTDQHSVDKTWLDSLSLQSQQTRIHRATRYGSETCSHFQLTMGRVVSFPPSWWPPLSPSSEFGLFPVSEVELEVDSWLLLDLMPCCVSTVSVRHLDTISSMQRKSANRQVDAMFRKILHKLWKFYSGIDWSAQVRFSILQPS